MGKANPQTHQTHQTNGNNCHIRYMVQSFHDVKGRKVNEKPSQNCMDFLEFWSFCISFAINLINFSSFTTGESGIDEKCNKITELQGKFRISKFIITCKTYQTNKWKITTIIMT